MTLKVREYQRAYELVVNKMKTNSNVLGIIVLGSIVSGDIWEESDIDIMAITKEKDKNETIYSRISDVLVHINYVSKDLFINDYNNILKGGTFHKAFFSNKLIFCVDKEIETVLNSIKFYNDHDRDIRNIEILCNLLSSIHYTKKYLSTGRLETAYHWCVEMTENYARLVLGMKGYITDKDILTLAVNMEDSVEAVFKKLNSEENLKDKINYIIEFVNPFIDINIINLSKPIVRYINEVNKPISVREIKEHDSFRRIDGDLRLILERLVKDGLLIESTKAYLTHGEEILVDEIVYSIAR